MRESPTRTDTRGQTALDTIVGYAKFVVVGYAVIAASLLSYYAAHPWVAANAKNPPAVLAVWLLTTVAVLYVISKQY